MRQIMITVFKRKVSVALRAEAEAKLHTAADHAAPNETGGILLGWWDEKTIVLEDVAEVADIDATPNSWTRHKKLSQEALDAVLARSSNSLLGYIGDWHSHPAVCDASSVDIASLRRASKQYSQALLLIVRLPNGKLDIHAARQGKLCQVSLKINYAEEIK